MNDENDRDDDGPVHYKSMFEGGEKDSPYLYACHLGFKDLTLTIAKVTKGKVVGTGGKSAGKPIVYWREQDQRPLALNKTNGAQITSLYGTANVKEWVGKRVTLYPTTTSFGKETVECIRIRPAIPEAPRGEFDIDGALAEINAADTAAKLAEVRSWLNRTPHPAKFKPQIKAALEDRVAKNKAAPQEREPGSDDE